MTRPDLRRSVRGWCSACKAYDLRADRKGIVSCANCGATDLLPTAEALASKTEAELERFGRRFAREVRRSLR